MLFTAKSKSLTTDNFFNESAIKKSNRPLKKHRLSFSQLKYTPAGVCSFFWIIENSYSEKYFLMMKTFTNEKPLVYSCSGCSSAAQTANYLAVQLDRIGEAEISCIARVGGSVKKIIRTVLSERKIITIDGFPLACSNACLSNHPISPDEHIELTQYGVRKQNNIIWQK